MSTTLYRKYRPQVFADVIGQEPVIQTLQNEVIAGQIAHAYLFSGPRGLGKTTTARLLAKAINCSKRDKKSAEPCNECETCQGISNGQSLDFIEIDAASNRGINEIRALKEHIGFTPSGSNYRVFIIDEVHMLTTEAFNALLKTLEEPPVHAVFILATTELHKVPDTIQSRCQTFAFKKASRENLMKRLKHLTELERVTVDDAVLDIIITRSGGFIRDAESLLGQVLSLGKKKIDVETASIVLPHSQHEHVYSMFGFLAEKNTREALMLIAQLVDEGVDLDFYARELLEAVRQLILVQHGVEIRDTTLTDYAEKFSQRDTVRLAQLVDRAVAELKQADIPQLPLELMVIEFIGTDSDSSHDSKPEVAPAGKQEAPSEEVVEEVTYESVSDEGVAKYSASKEEEGPVRRSPKDVGGLTNEPKKSTNNSAQEPKAPKKPKKFKTSFDDVKLQWQTVVSHGRKHNHSLALALNMVHPLSMDGGVLTIGGAYEFHCERLSDVENSKLIEQVLLEAFGEPISLAVKRITEEEAEKLKPEGKKVSVEQEEKLIDGVLATFGGSVVSD